MSVHTTDDANAFIAGAEDCPADVGTAPRERMPASIARLQDDMLVGAPYRTTSDEVLFGVHARVGG